MFFFFFFFRCVSTVQILDEDRKNWWRLQYFRDNNLMYFSAQGTRAKRVMSLEVSYGNRVILYSFRRSQLIDM